MTETRHPVGGLSESGLPSVLLPHVVHETNAAILVVDLERRAVTYANDLARQFAPEATLPLPVDEWSAAAGLADLTGEELPQGAIHAPDGRIQPLLRVAQGEPVQGEGVTARRATDAVMAREPLWVVGLPLLDAPPPLTSLALVALLPLRNAQLVAGTQEAAALLRDRAMLATKVAFTITDPTLPDNPLVWVNPAFTDTTGYSFDEAVGRNCRFLQGERSDRRVVADIRRGLDAHRPVTTTILNYRKDGTPFWNELSVSPILDGAGAVTHFVGVQTDVTARVQAQRSRDEALERAEVAAGRLALLADFATRLTGSLENEDILALFTDVLVPRLGTWCAVHLVENGDIGTRSIVRHADGGIPEIHELVGQIATSLESGLPVGSPAARVLRGDVPYVLVPDVEADPVAAGVRADERNELARRLGTRSLMIVPLRSRSRVLGCAAVMADRTRETFDEADLALARELSTRTALMLENSMLYTRERTAAVTLQRSMMPNVAQLPGLTMAARYLTASDEASVGGDWYDAFRLQDGRIGLAVGDAMGHDTHATAAMGQLSTMLRAYAWPGTAAPDVLGSVDSLITGTRLGILATCCYGCLRLDADEDGSARFDFANAGHPAPLLRAPDGTVEVLGGGHGPMLGVQPLLAAEGAVIARTSATAVVPLGATLVFYSDGLTDSLGDELDATAAQQRLAEIVARQPLQATPRQLVAALVEFAAGGRTDDVVIVAIRVNGA